MNRQPNNATVDETERQIREAIQFFCIRKSLAFAAGLGC